MTSESTRPGRPNTLLPYTFKNTLNTLPWRRIIVLGMQLSYYGAAVIKVRDFTRTTTNGHTYTPLPDWGWVLAAIAGVMWLIIAGISACTWPLFTHTPWKHRARHSCGVCMKLTCLRAAVGCWC